jgi:osmoprotectant transport system permease protein
VVGSKKITESVILGEMVALLLEEKFNQPVVRKLGLAGTQVAFDGLKRGDIDVYPDYTGTGYVMILKQMGEKDPDRVFNIVNQEFGRRWGIVWSNPLGFNNTYAIAVRSDDQKFSKVQAISDLTGSDLLFTYAAAHEFMERKDGHEEFVKAYDLKFDSQRVLAMEAGLMYSAVRDKKVDMIVAYSTDGRIKAYDLRILKDDRKYFPPYFVSLLAKSENLQKFPALRNVFAVMEGLITEAEMVKMNDEVDRLKRDSRVVAREFLVTRGLLEKGTESGNGVIGFLIAKKDYFFKILWEHLTLSFGALLLSLVVSLPTGILLTRYQKLGSFVFPVVNTIQTIPSLALLGFLIPVLGIGFVPALLALFLYSLLPLIRNTYTGILGVDKTYIEVAKGIGLTPFQILVKIELPLALPIILAGLRTAAVIVIGTTTLAALIGAGGLGDPIFRGVATVNSKLILLGAIPSALLAIVVDKLINASEKALVSKGLRLKRDQ